METVKSPEVLALSVEHESAFKVTEAQVLACQHEVQSLQGKLQKAEKRSEELEQALKEKDEKIQQLVDDAQSARREVVDKEQALGVLEMKLANTQKSYDQDKEVSGAAMKALQKDKNSSLELVTECRDLRVQVATLSTEVYTENHRADDLEKARDILQNQVKSLSSSLTSERHNWLQEKLGVLGELETTKMALISAESTVEALRGEESEFLKKIAALSSEKNDLINNTMEQYEYWAAKDRELKSELERMTRARDVFEVAAEHRDKRIEQLEALCTELSKTVHEQSAVHDKFVQDAELLHSELDAELAKYKNVVDSFNAAYIPIHSTNPENAVSPDIKPIDDITKVELYKKYAELLEACKRGKEDLKRRTEYVHHLTSEKKTTLAYVTELRAKFDLQSQECADLKIQIQSSEASRISDIDTISQLQGTVDRYQKMLESAEASTKDLSSQVEYLLKENMRIKKFHAPSQRQQARIQDGSSDADRAISKDLVLVGDVHDLVKQNADLRRSLRIVVADCEEKEVSWRLGMEKEKEKLANLYIHELDDVKKRLEDKTRRLQTAEKEKSIYFDLMIKDKPGIINALPDLTSGPQSQDPLTNLRGQICDLERKLMESEKVACHVTLLEAQLKRLRDELAEVQKQSIARQDAQNKSLEKYQGMKEKLQQLGRSLNNTQIQLATQEEATRCARLNSIEWEHKAEELQGRAIDLSSQVSVLLAEKNNAIEFRDTTLSELKRVTSERTALAARLDILESKHKTDASKTETEGILAQGEVQSSVNAALARIGEDIQSMAQQAAYHKNLEEERMRLESTVRDLESKAAELASKITTLESALTSRDAQVVEMQKLIDLQNETPGASAESARKLFNLRQQLAAAQEEGARHKATAEQMQTVARENDSKLRDAKELGRDKEEQLESVKAEMLTYKKKLTTLAKTMKAPMDERRQIELELTTAKAQASSANESKEKAEQSLLTVTSELEKARKLVYELETSVSLIQNDKQTAEEEAAAQQILAVSGHQEVEKLQADLLKSKEQLREVAKNHDEVVKDMKDRIATLEESQKVLEIKCSTVELEHNQTLQRLVEKEEEMEQLQHATNTASQVPFDVQQELERLRMFESVHQEDVITIKGENEGLKLETRSLFGENESLRSQLTSLQGEIQDLKTRIEKLSTDRLAESNELRNTIARQERAITLKDDIIANLKLQLAQSSPKEDRNPQKHTPGDTANMQTAAPVSTDGLASLTGSGQLSQLRQRVVERMLEGKPNFTANSQLQIAQVDEMEGSALIPSEAAAASLAASTGAVLAGVQDTTSAPEVQFGVSSTKRRREDMEALNDSGDAPFAEAKDKKSRFSNTESLGAIPSSPAINFGSGEDDIEVVETLGALGSGSEFEDGGENPGEGECRLSTEPEEGEYGSAESPTTSKDLKEDETHLDTQSRPAPGTAFANRRRRPGRSKRSSVRGRGRGRATKDAEGGKSQE